jgi:tRNA(Ile)-lysidine synthase
MTPSKLIVAKNISEKEKELPLSGKISYGHYNIETKIISPPIKLKAKGCEFFDLDCLELPLKVRIKKIGDRLVTFGAGNSKKIKDVFIDNKIPRILREVQPIVYDKKGVILIPGIKRSNRAPVLKETGRILEIKYKEVANAGKKR